MKPKGLGTATLMYFNKLMGNQHIYSIINITEATAADLNSHSR